MGSLFEHVFSCGKCGKELGRSDRPFDKPPYDKCPYCGVRFINGGHGFSRPGSSFKPSDGQGQQPNFGGGFTPPEQNFPNPGFDNAFNNTPFTGGGDSFDEDEESDPFERLQAPLGRRLLLAAIVGGVGLVVIAGVVGLVFLVSRAGSGSSRPRRRRRARNDDDDDYEDAPRPRSRVRRY
jgi:DNA-directed RNA polymerase subunit RPC12/RpoP